MLKINSIIKNFLVYIALSSAIDRSARADIDEALQNECFRDEKYIDIENLIERVGDILKGARWDKARIREFLIYGNMFNNTEEKLKYIFGKE